MRSANTRDASTNCGSFKSTRACNGVFVLSRRVRQVVRPSALNTHIRRWNLSFPICVKTPAIEIITRALGEPGIRRSNGVRPKQLSRLIRIHARTALFFFQQAADRQCVITHKFRRKSSSGPPRKQVILRVNLARTFRTDTCLTIGGGKDHQPQESFHVPARFNKVDRKIIQQLWVAR